VTGSILDDIVSAFHQRLPDRARPIRGMFIAEKVHIMARFVIQPKSVICGIGREQACVFSFKELRSNEEGEI
jgi:hypothetical protein